MVAFGAIGAAPASIDIGVVMMNVAIMRKGMDVRIFEFSIGSSRCPGSAYAVRSIDHNSI
jgi:hypothetical protein